MLANRWTPRLRSRPKLTSDQTFQTKIISDQTFQTEIVSDQTFQTEIVSDQTFQTQSVLIRLSRPKEFWSDHLQTMVQTQNQTIVQTIIRLWSDPISDPSSLWSDSDETISPADHSDQKHSKSQSSDDKLESIIDHFVAMTMHLLKWSRNKCQLLDFIQIFQRIFQESEEKVELHEERLFITFWRRRVRKSMIAHFVAVVFNFWNLWRN